MSVPGRVRPLQQVIALEVLHTAKQRRQPSCSPLTPSGHAEVFANHLELLANSVQLLCRKWSTTNPCGICFASPLSLWPYYEFEADAKSAYTTSITLSIDCQPRLIPLRIPPTPSVGGCHVRVRTRICSVINSMSIPNKIQHLPISSMNPLAPSTRIFFPSALASLNNGPCSIRNGRSFSRYSWNFAASPLR